VKAFKFVPDALHDSEYQVEVEKMKVEVEILGLAVFIQDEAW
jgi:hypothetical protein